MKGLPQNASRMASNTFAAFLRAVEMYPRMRAKSLAPSSVLNPPETFCFSLTMRTSLSARLLSNGTRKSCMNAKG